MKLPLKLGDKLLKPPVFIAGCGRSGTTLLLRILGKNKNIYSVIRETHFFLKDFIAPALLSIERLEKIKKLIIPQWILAVHCKELEEKKDFKNLTLIILSVMFRGVVDALEMVKRKEYPNKVIKLYKEIQELPEFSELKNKNEVFNLCANFLTITENKQRWAEKSAENTFSGEDILKLYPDAKFIDVVRDPRAVYLSWINSSHEYFKETSNLSHIVRSWKNHIIAGDKLSEIAPAQFIRIRYEDLLSAPERELKSLCKFLEEDFDPQMLDVNVYQSSFDEMNPLKGFRKEASFRWKKLLSKEEIMLIDSKTKEIRDRLGYADSGIKPSFSNLFPYAALVTKECIKSRHEIKDYIKAKLRPILRLRKI